MLIAAHESRHRTFTEWIDGSVINENEPENRDPELDIYNPENPNQPAYNELILRNQRGSEGISEQRTITIGNTDFGTTQLGQNTAWDSLYESNHESKGIGYNYFSASIDKIKMCINYKLMIFFFY